MGKAIFKFNGGRGALLCSNCSVIIKTGKDFTEQEWAALRGEGDINSVYCDKCKDKVVDIDEIVKDPKNNLGVLKDIVPMLAENPEFRENLVKIISEKMLNNINLDENDERIN
jgi:hypothetical protein